MNSDKNKQYYLDNRDKILKKKGQKFDCECGGRYTYSHKAEHLNSKKHKNYIDNKDNNNIDNKKNTKIIKKNTTKKEDKNKIKKIIKKLNHLNYFQFTNGILDLNTKIFHKI